MRRNRLLPVLALAAALLGAGARAQAGGEAAQDPARHAEPAAHGEQRSTLEMSNADIFAALHSHSVPHVVWPATAHGEAPPFWAFYNVNQWQWIALAIVLLLMLNVASSFNRSGQPGWITRVFRGFCRWIRDEMVYAVMGKEEGRKWVPFFLFLFFFVAGMNVIGLPPAIGSWVQPTTATGTPYVTGPLAVITLALMLGFGMRQNGVLGFFKGLLPHGLPIALIPLMFVVELVGLIIKPFALMVRLFANMLAGHLVVASTIGLIFVFTKMFGGSIVSYGPAVVAVGMAAFIYILESFVTLLQAYIFTYLSIIFLHQAIHQEH
jgi:F-type H+-transporting ATPase subunit a